jgi:hypothetical protein
MTYPDGFLYEKWIFYPYLQFLIRANPLNCGHEKKQGISNLFLFGKKDVHFIICVNPF